MARGHAVRIPGPDPDLETLGIELPPGVNDVVLLGDSDSDRALTECALYRAQARFGVGGAGCGARIVRVAWANLGMDFNDMVRG
jgi:hypothetical protein